MFLDGWRGGIKNASFITTLNQMDTRLDVTSLHDRVCHFDKSIANFNAEKIGFSFSHFSFFRFNIFLRKTNLYKSQNSKSSTFHSRLYKLRSMSERLPWILPLVYDLLILFLRWQMKNKPVMCPLVCSEFYSLFKNYNSFPTEGGYLKHFLSSTNIIFNPNSVTIFHILKIRIM